MLNGAFLRGFAIGVGVATIVPIAAVALLVGHAPLRRALERGCEMLSGKAREAVAETGEIIEDLIAESRINPERRAAEDACSPATGFRRQESGDAAPGSD